MLLNWKYHWIFFQKSRNIIFVNIFLLIESNYYRNNLIILRMLLHQYFTTKKSESLGLYLVRGFKTFCRKSSTTFSTRKIFIICTFFNTFFSLFYFDIFFW